MSEPWTPGPWTANKYVGDADNWFVRGAAQERVCGQGSGPVVESNAHLIAAAPELAEVVKAFIDETVDYATRNNLGDPEKQHNVKWGRSVLAKARGES
jgi:uncharacterized phage protein gp47/JayE